MATTIDTDNVRRRLEAGAQLLEVLPRKEYEEEHLPGAVSIPLAEIDEQTHELDSGRPVIVYCFDYQ
jgi:rhodanese-related sulfurtransferase